ncbi:MAG: glycoside hydrolase domain-containing protein, partial [Candidatus Hodarchaeota archaeon]
LASNPTLRTSHQPPLFLQGLLFAFSTFIVLYSVYPKIILDQPEDIYNTVPEIYFWIGIALMAGMLIVFVLQGYHLLNLAAELISHFSVLIVGLMLLGSHAESTQNNWEWWLIQTGWFFHENGVIIGIFACTTMIFTIITIARIINDVGGESQNFKTLVVIAIFGSYLGNYALMNELLDPHGFFPFLLYFLIIGGAGFLIQLIIFLITSTEGNERDPEGQGAEIEKEETRVEFGENRNEGMNKSARSTLKQQKPFHGLVKLFKNTDFAWMLLFIIVQLAYLILCKITRITFASSFEWELLYPILGGVLLLSMWSLSTKLKRENVAPAPPKNKVGKRIGEQFGILFMMLVTAARIFFPLYLIARFTYGFKTSFYMASFQATLAEFAFLGVVLFLIFRKSKKILYTIYIICLLLQIYLVFAVNDDIALNAYNYDHIIEFDIIYPFQVLLSPLHAGIIGISLGFILTFEMNRLFFKKVTKKNLSIRACLLTVIPFLLGIIMMLYFDSGNIPGGVEGTYIPVEKPFLGDYLDSLFQGILILIGIVIVIDLIVPLVWKKVKARVSIERTGPINRPIPMTYNRGKPKRGHVIALGLAVAILLPVGLVYSMPKLQNGYSLPLVVSDGAVDVFAAPSYARISSGQFIKAQDPAVQPVYNLSLARNEYESFQLIVQPKRRSLHGLECSISDFKNGNETIPGSNINIRYAELIYGSMPEKLVPFSKLDIMEQRNHIFWVQCYAPYTAEMGSYLGNITFHFGGDESFLIRLSLDVWNFTFPNQRHVRSHFGTSTTNPEKIATYITHGMNVEAKINEAGSFSELQNNEEKTCWWNDTAQDWVFNWTWWDAKIEYNLNNSMNGFSIDYPKGFPNEPETWLLPNGSYTPWAEQMGKYFVGVQAHLEDKRDNESKNWFNYGYLYFMDEFEMRVPEGISRQDYWDDLEPLLDLLNQSCPEIKIMTTTAPFYELRQLAPYFDIYCPETDDYNKTEGDWALDQGKEVWMYTCVNPGVPYPNSHTFNRLFEARVLYWQLWRNNLHGFLYWATTYYLHNDYGYGYNSWGDGWLLYEEADGTVYDTIRWEAYGDAIDDYEYLWLMNATITAKGGDADATSLLNKLVDSVTTGPTEFCDSGSVIYSARESIGNWISDEISKGLIDLETISESEWLPPGNT